MYSVYMKIITSNVCNKFLLAIHFLFVTLVIQWNPTGVEPYPFFNSILTAFLYGLIGSVIFYGIITITDSIFSFVKLMTFCSVSAFLCIAGVVFSGVYIHRDYFVIPFQIIVIFYILFLRHAVKSKFNRHFKKIIFIITISELIVLLQWTIFVSYAIVVRSEPRWIESIFYNTYNSLLIFMLFFYTYKFYYLIKRKVIISSESLVVDDNNLDEIFNKEHIIIIKALFTNTATCSFLRDELNLNNVSNTCEECHNKEYTASLCKAYKNIYNKILFTKKIISLLNLGEVVYPENKFNIKKIGWKLIIRKNIDVIIK